LLCPMLSLVIWPLRFPQIPPIPPPQFETRPSGPWPAAQPSG
jgi:hypothetical protein